MQKPKIFRGITGFITFSFIIFNCTVVLLFIVWLYSAVSSQHKLITVQQRLIAQNAANSVKLFIQEKIESLDKTVGLIDLIAVGTQQQRTILEDFLGKDLSIRQMVLLNLQKQELARVSRLSKTLSSQSMKYDYHDLMSMISQKEKYAGPIYIDDISYEPMMVLAVPQVDVFGDIKGVLMAEVNLKFMWELIGNIKIGNTGLAYVVDKNGRLIAFKDISRVLKSENLSNIKEVNKFVNANNALCKDSSAEISRGIEGAMVLSSHAHLYTPDWAIITELPIKEAYCSVIGQIRTTVIVLIINLLFSFFLARIIAGRIASPIKKLRDATQKFGKGELNSEIKIESKDEIGELAVSFNWMVENLRKTTVSIEELRKEQKRFQDIALNAGEWIWEVDVTGRYTYSSPVVETILGYKSEEIIGKYFHDFFDPEERDKLKDAAFGAFSRKEPFRNFLNRNMHKDGRTVFIETSAVPILSSDGTLTGYRGVDYDVTFRKKAEEELRRTHLQLMRSEKLASVGQLAAGIAHEINNPIGFVVSNSDTISKYMTRIFEILNLYSSGTPVEDIAERKKELKIDFIMEDIMSLLKESKEGLQRVVSIVQNLKNFSRIDSSREMAKIDINECLKTTLAVVSNKIKYNAEVKTDFGFIDPILCNAGEINQVFLNIIMNAAQAIQEQNSGKGTILVVTWQDSGSVFCEIQDDGPGIPPEVLSRIFDPFFTTKEAGKGMGLGLNISYDIIVNRHKGNIEVESKVGRGTRFLIKLPKNLAADGTKPENIDAVNKNNE